MTFDDLANFVCPKVNQVDAISLGICKTFINRRYQMIYDTENWQDSMDSLAVPVAVGDPLVTFDYATIERITTIQVQPPTGFSTRFSTTLEKVDHQFISESFPELDNPDTTVNQSKPLYYIEFIDRADNIRKIKLYPVPDKVYILNVHGKATFLPLSTGTDVPVLRNIDNCLISYVHGDMLQRQRQYQKAQDMFTEAAAQLELMRKLEKENSNLPRRTKNITVSGDSLAEMVDAVSCRVGDYSAPAQIIIKEYLRRKYQDVWDSNLWLESTVMARVQRDGSEVILPEYFGTAIDVRANSALDALIPNGAGYLFGVSPSVFEQSGSPYTFGPLTPSSVAQLPVGTEQMMFVSSDDSDKSPVFIRGEAGGVEVTEVIVLNGTTPVPTYNVYDMPMTTAKQITAGYVDVTGRVSGTFLVRLLADERERKHIRLWLQPFPSDTIDGTECLVLGKRRIHPLMTDEDTPLLRGIGNALISLACASWFTKMGNDKAAAAASTEAQQSIEIMKQRETNQTAYQPVILPAMDGSFSYGYDGVGMMSKGYW